MRQILNTDEISSLYRILFYSWKNAQDYQNADFWRQRAIQYQTMVATICTLGYESNAQVLVDLTHASILAEDMATTITDGESE